ncbi:MAG: hypothetical protein GTN89_01220 [Acidobacteria bacterium]|nr:hypothetical protein [Acidobacteriota bacterium]NIM60937.1 hypothetical protein [Acidobacteriota bacterium]NIO58005.1 hypothetical protein [Acidobacteriota bacterium]NIQ29012.1 hypothetical protein [Acidobacteriota bacterium]NIQ83536.1 hypothetical protein [Acidobacteriota bacterium]
MTGLGLAVVLVPVIPDPSPGFAERKGDIASVRETASWMVGNDVVTELTLRSTSGLEVELSVRRPADASHPRPLILMLAGVGTGRNAVRFPADTGGVVMAALSYPYRGDRHAGTGALLLDLPRMQRALLDTIPAVLLATDWLMQQPYVDPGKVELAGGSMGAFVVSVPGALDTRFRRVWIVHGGAAPALVFRETLKDRIRFAPARALTAELLAAIACSHHLAPEKWVGRISPRPVVVVNARDDESIPKESVERLHRALGDPSEVIWTQGGHVLPDREAVIEALAEVILSKMREDETL